MSSAFVLPNAEQRYYAAGTAYLRGVLFGKGRQVSWREYWDNVNRASATFRAAASNYDATSAPGSRLALAYARCALGVITQLQWIGRATQLSPPRAHVLRSAGVVPPMRELQRLGTTEAEREDALLALWAMDAFRPEDTGLRAAAENLAHQKAYS
jgi:hypothetical protein